MSDIVLFARITARPGAEADMASALQRLVAASVEEPGCQVYTAHQQDDAPGTFWFYEVYDDEDALAVHARGPLMTEARGGVREFGAGPPEIWRVSPIAHKP